MLTFDSKGLLVPNTIIEASVADLKHYFVDSMKQWINGSFVTKTRNPKDIDFVTFIDFDLRMKFYAELRRFEAKGANDIFDVDAYLLTVFPDGHEKVFLFQSDRTYWIERFSRTRRDNFGKKNPKGFLEIIY